ncbi:DUF922 domain-containing Zn-dependent protease [Rhizobium paknamense]|uniref:Secreted Zn-dependent protease n=1 Tax=Rhizobium paknamense TaxID=1206817 RepID=A0ABU0II05_9HYPH|nr:DUF922 domain-containing protein [Rhizobium paknamense]MDQ0457900.1 putative secreted Zn-dependent protease [Rhizobium paknamense]
MPCPGVSRQAIRASLVMLAGMVASSPAQAGGTTREVIKPYAISGTSGPELYASIGEKGPAIGNGGRAIAHTTFTLTWKRSYEPQGQACVLTQAVPTLTITYTLPRPSGSLSSPTRENWQAFIAGIETHERTHGAHIKVMTAEIEAASLGLRAENDPKCQKVREELNRRLKEISDRKREKDRLFEQEEMKNGGNIQRLILALVNGH